MSGIIIELVKGTVAFETLRDVMGFENTYQVRVAVNAGEVTVKGNEGMWTPPLGAVVKADAISRELETFRNWANDRTDLSAQEEAGGHPDWEWSDDQGTDGYRRLAAILAAIVGQETGK